VLAVLRRGTPLARALPPLLGAVVAFGALLPSLPYGHAAHPVLALVGLVLGLGISVAPLRVAVGVAIACVVLGLAPAGARDDVRAAWKTISAQRLTTDSSDRGQERRAAVRLVREHPATGVGPGRVVLQWGVYYFVPVDFTVRYAHDEYLQLAAESGVIGLAIAAVGVGFVLVELRRTARGAPRNLAGAGIAAAFVMLALHSATDFLWHVPLVPVAASVFVGVLATRENVGGISEISQPHSDGERL
jgi:O-antigen ligase